MSSSEPKILISMIGPSSSTPELIKSIRHSFRDCEFDEVQKIITDREKNMEMEIENLVRDRDGVTKEVRLLERSHGLAELENSKLERKCEELEEKITRLIEEQSVSSDREKRAKERCDKVCDENAKMASEKNKIIFELNEKINKLNNKSLESERLLGFLNEKFRRLDAEAAKMEEVIKDLRHEKLNANRTMDELRVAKLESDKAAESNKKRFEDLAPRIMKVEEALTNILNVKVEDIGKIVDDLDNAAAEEEGGNVNFVESKGEKDILGNGDAEENAGVMSPGVRSTCNSSENVPKKGGRNDDAANSVETSRGAQSGSDPPQVENNATDQEIGSKALQGSGAHAKATGSDGGVPVKDQLISGQGHCSKMASKYSAARDIIDLCDSDDETNPGEECKKDSLVRSTPKRKRSDYDDIIEPMDQVLELDSDDESCSDSDMDNLVANIRRKKVGRKWMAGDDMLKAFSENAELCMNAVCALYRQEVFAANGSDLSKSQGFSHVDAASGRALAEYLIDGDPEFKRRKSVLEVEKQRPDVIEQCKRLATNYHEKLFQIYCSGEDHLFCQT